MTRISDKEREIVSAAWEGKKDDLSGGEILRGTDVEKYNIEHPVMSEEEALEVIRKSQEGE